MEVEKIPMLNYEQYKQELSGMPTLYEGFSFLRQLTDDVVDTEDKLRRLLLNELIPFYEGWWGSRWPHKFYPIPTDVYKHIDNIVNSYCSLYFPEGFDTKIDGKYCERYPLGREIPCYGQHLQYMDIHKLYHIYNKTGMYEYDDNYDDVRGPEPYVYERPPPLDMHLYNSRRQSPRLLKRALKQRTRAFSNKKNNIIKRTI